MSLFTCVHAGQMVSDEGEFHNASMWVEDVFTWGDLMLSLVQCTPFEGAVYTLKRTGAWSSFSLCHVFALIEKNKMRTDERMR